MKIPSRATLGVVLLHAILPLNLQAAVAGSGTWVLNPIDNDWGTPANWSLDTVPNGPGDVATFAISQTTDIVISAATELSAWTFNPDASSYFTTVNGAILVRLSGAGITNTSGIAQTIFARADPGGDSGTVLFTGSAAARGSISAAASGSISFITEGSPTNNIANGGVISFGDSSRSANCTFRNQGATVLGGFGGRLLIAARARMMDASVTNEPGTVEAANGGWTTFEDTCTVSNSVIRSEGASTPGALGGRTWFFERSGVSGSILIADGATVAGGKGGEVFFDNFSNAGNATLIANSGANGGDGGLVRFIGFSQTETARVEAFGNGTVDFSDVLPRQDPTIIGSLEGDGIVIIGTNSGTDTIEIGTNDLSTTFSGVIQEDATALGTGAIIKVGAGTLTLSGANTYGAGTNITSGALIVNNTEGSATGTGFVTVQPGTLGGSGTISGAVTVGSGGGTGGVLAPAFGSNKQVSLTLQSTLTLQADATYTYTFKAKKDLSRTDLIIANGITINGATIALQGQTEGRLKRGLILTVLSNTSASPISGTFSNLTDGAIVNVNGNNFQASYSGGDGNDLTLAVVP